MKKSKLLISVIAMAALVVTLFSGAFAVNAADVLYESSAEYDSSVEPGVTTGASYEVEFVIHVRDMNPSPDSNIRGFKMILGQLANGADVELWVGADMAQLNDSAWTSGAFVRVNHDFSTMKGKDSKVKVTVNNGNIVLYVDDAKICTFAESKLQLAATSVFSMGQWDTPYTVKSMKITGAASSSGGSGNAANALYQSSGSQNDAIKPGVVTGSGYDVDLTIRFNNLKPSPDENIRGVKFVLGQLSNGSNVELWIGANMLQLNDSNWTSGVFQRVEKDLSYLEGKEADVKLSVKNGNIRLTIDGQQIADFSESALAPVSTSRFSMDQWDSSFTVITMTITANEAGNAPSAPSTPTTPTIPSTPSTPTAPAEPVEPDLGELGSNTATGDDWYYNDFGGKFYNGMNAPEGASSTSFILDDAYSFNYQLEVTLNINNIRKDSGRGVKFILREHSLASSGDLEVWIGHDSIWACATGWVGHTAFDMSTFMNRDFTVRLVVKDRSIRMFFDGFEVWSCEDPGFMIGKQTNVEIGGWDAKYQIKYIRQSPVVPDSEMPTPEMNEEYTYPTPEMGGTKYYVDSGAAAGGDGLSPETAWNSIQQINDHGPFLPDDQILLKRGSLWEGVTLQPQGYGVEGHPIIIDSYGEGELPIIDRKGEWVPGGLNGTSAVILKNQSYWTIRNIQVSNQNPVNPGTVEEVVVLADHAEFPMRNGIHISAGYVPGNKANIVRGIVLENVVFANIDGTQGDEGNCYYYRVSGQTKSGWAGGGALCVRANDLESGESRAYFDGVTVLGCTFRNIGGIGVSTESGWVYYDSFKNVTVRNCKFYNEDSYKATFTGMYIVSAEAPVIEYNSMENMTNGIGFQVCNDAVAQYNTIVDMDGYLHTMSKFMKSEQYWDGCGIDADCRCKGTTILRNNYIERCYAGSFGFFDYQETLPANIVIENNISYNSGRFIYYQCDTGSYTFDIRHNTVIRTKNSPYTSWDQVIDIYNGDLGAGKMNVVGNVFYYPDQNVEMPLIAAKYSRNTYIGIKKLPSDIAAVTADPMINLPAKDEDTANLSFNGNINGTTSFVDSGLFTYKDGSPCFVGKELLCGVDFAVLKGEAEKTPEPSVIPTNPTVPEETQPATEPDETVQPTEPTEQKPDGLSGGAIAAIVIAALAVVGAAAFIVLKRRGLIK